MSIATELPELRNAFDRFSLWILLRYANTADSINLIHGERVHPDLCNFLLAVIWNGNEENPELAILEHHLTKVLFESVSENSRKDAIERLMRFCNILPSKCSTQHFIHITNEWPPVETVAFPMVLLKKGDLYSIDVSNLATDALCTISAACEGADAISTNVYNVSLYSGQTIRQVLQQSPSQAKSTPESTRFHMDAKPVNGIKLQDLTALLNEDGDAPLGLFLVRQAKLKDILLYVKKCCVDRLEDVAPDTWFLVSETVPFETNFSDHATVHEVAYVTDYGIVFWLRSRGLQPTPIETHFTVHCWDEYDSVPPAPGWLNILVSNVSDGSTTYLKQLAEGVKRANPFQIISLLQAADMMEALRKPNASWMELFCQLLGAQKEAARQMVGTIPLVLLIDHAIADDGSDHVAQTLILFLNSLNDSSILRRLTVWIVGDDVLWTRFVTDCKHASIKHTIPKLDDEEQWRECLSRMVPLQSAKVDREHTLKKIIANNGPMNGTPFFGTVFTCAVLVEHIADHADGKVTGTLSYWWIDAMERFVWKYIAPAGSIALETLEADCYERVFRACNDRTKIFSSHSKIMHRTLQILLAVNHLAKHPELIEFAYFERVGYNLIDLMLFRHSAVARAVLQHNVEALRQSSAEELRSVTDCLDRNLLHVVHNSIEIADVLLLAEVPLEQRCAAQLRHWTPLQMAIERNDWPLVDRLLAKGAMLNTMSTSKLKTMAVTELADIFCDCIATNCTTLIRWILENRSDYQITQRNVYTLSVYEEFDTDLLFRLLTVAQDQGLPDRDPQPYRYIFGNSALDNAVDDERFELATFLVERLKFDATDEFNELRTRFEQNPKLNEYKLFYKLCREGELAKVQQMVEESGLDPQHEYDGSNAFIQAAASGNLQLVQYLFERHGFHARINDRDQHGCTAMSQAMVEGHQPIVQFLRSHNAVVNSSWIQRSSNESVDGVEIDTEDFLALIVCKREKLNKLKIDYNRYDGGELLLHFYIRYVDEPDEDTFRFILSQYDTVDIRTDVTSNLRGGETPLHLAYQNGNKRCREILLELGADIQAKSLRYGLTSLHYAIMGGADKESLQQLIEGHGFDVNTRDERGRTISFYMPLRTELYRWLIERYQFDPCAPDSNGQTVLHHKVIKNSFFARAEIEYLLRTVNVSQSHTDSRGRLPLHYAAEAGSREIVRLLLKYRQDLCNVSDSEGLTPVQIAQNLNHSEIVNLFTFLTVGSC